jgi:hypothetical protein
VCFLLAQVVQIDGNNDAKIECTSDVNPGNLSPLHVTAVADQKTWDFTVVFFTGSVVNCDKCFTLTRPIAASEVTTKYNSGTDVLINICGAATTDHIDDLGTRMTTMEASQKGVTDTITSNLAAFDTENSKLNTYKDTEAPSVRTTLNTAGQGWQDFSSSNTNVFDMQYVETDNDSGGTTTTFTFTDSEKSNKACGTSASDTTNYVMFKTVVVNGVSVTKLHCVQRSSAWGS